MRYEEFSPEKKKDIDYYASLVAGDKAYINDGLLLVGSKGCYSVWYINPSDIGVIFERSEVIREELSAKVNEGNTFLRRFIDLIRNSKIL